MINTSSTLESLLTTACNADTRYQYLDPHLGRQSVDWMNSWAQSKYHKSRNQFLYQMRADRSCNPKTRRTNWLMVRGSGSNDLLFQLAVCSHYLLKSKSQALGGGGCCEIALLNFRGLLTDQQAGKLLAATAFWGQNSRCGEGEPSDDQVMTLASLRQLPRWKAA